MAHFACGERLSRMRVLKQLLQVLAASSLGAALLLTASCANYHLGTSGHLAFSTIYIEPVTNKTLLPQAQAVVSTQLGEYFLRDRRVTLVNSDGAADVSLKVTIVDYHREVATVREGDTGLARKFTLTLGVVCTLRENHEGRLLFENRPISVHRDAFTDGGQLQSEYQTLPLLAETLADKISHSVLDVW